MTDIKKWQEEFLAYISELNLPRDDCRGIMKYIEEVPAQPEVKPIGYQDCANAMLKMWMDNVVTDGEYNRIMDKLNAHWRKRDG